ncbi:MAG TPA: GGDEF domain-containing protein [Holophagaceae bacterium]
MEGYSPDALPTFHATVTEFRFKEYERLSLSLSLIITCLGPLLTFVQDLLLNPHLAGLSLRIGLCSMGILGLYPLALGLGLSRRLIQAIAVLSPSIVVCMDLLLRADQPGDVTRSIVLLLYLIAYARILALPFGLPVTITSIAMLLLIPLGLMVSGFLPGLSAVRILIPLIPMALMMFFLELLLTRNLHETHRQRKMLEELAIQDPLTGLHNRRYFVMSAAEHHRLAIRNGHPLCILMVDLDHFKRINDTFGHATGDQVIRLTSDVLRNELRASDILARFGGEEFIACLPDTEQSDARVAAERIRSSLEGATLPAPEDEGPVLRVTASIGVAASSGPESLDRLIERADQALYIAKNRGRNQVVCAD